MIVLLIDIVSIVLNYVCAIRKRGFMFVNVKSVNKALQTRETMLNHVFLNRRFGTNILVAPTVK